MRSAAWRQTKVWAAGAILAMALPVMAACSSSSPSSSTGSNSGNNGAAAAGTSVNMTEVMGSPDKYAFTPASATVTAGSSISVTNKTDEDHSLTCSPSGGAADVKVAKAGSGTLTFSKAGSYTCKSTEHPDAVLSVTVS